MAPRYFAATAVESPWIELTDSEAHHASRVMRARVGETLVVFDGSGTEFVGRIESITKDRVRLRVLDRRRPDRERPQPLVLGVALPKGERQKWLIEKSVELGVSRFVPLQSERSVAKPQGQVLRRLRRTVIEASKQCGRNQLMEITAAVKITDYFRQESARAAHRLLADPEGEPWKMPDRLPHTHVFVAVGPEGGLTSEERAVAQRTGWQSVSLGPRTLRIETAALAIVARCSGW